MKAILMSIRPQHVANILNGIKTLEIRKKFPKDYVGWVYIYCTKDKKYANLINRGGFLTGMVVARFWCDKVETIHRFLVPEQCYMTYDLDSGDLLQKSCLSFKELDDYLLGGNGYAIYTTNLEIFDKPKEIKEFNSKIEKTCICFNQFVAEGTRKIPLTRAPQSWCYIEV